MNQPKQKIGSRPKSLRVQCKRSLNVLFILTCALTLTGCQQSMPLQIPANLKQRCPDLLQLESGQGKDVLQTMVDDRRKYVECSNKVDALIKLIE